MTSSSPIGRPPATRRARMPRGALVVVVVVALAGCNDAEPVVGITTTEPATTTRPTFDMTDFSMDQVADGSPLTWSRVIADESLRPRGVVELSEVTLVFAENGSGRGLRAWSSVDGAVWEDLGPVIPDESEVAVVASGGGHALVITDGAAGHNPEIWASTDGVSWTTEEIPLDSESELLAFSPQAFLETTGLRIVTGTWRLDVSEVVEEGVRQTTWPTYDVDRYGFAVRAAGESIEIDILGPAHLTLLTATAEELGMDDETQQLLRTGPGNEDAEAWVSFDDSGWTSTTVEGASSIDSLALAPGGDVIGAGSTQLEQALWQSFDGLIWEQVPYDVRPYAVADWNGRLIGPGVVGESDILASEDGLKWVGTGLIGRLPRGLNWQIETFAATAGGLVADIAAFDQHSFGCSFEDSSLIRRGDAQILVDPFSGYMSVFYEDGRQYDWSAGPQRESLAFDPTSETIRLFTPDGEELLDVTLDELDEAAEAFPTCFGDLGTYHRGLAYSVDGMSWTIWDLADLGEDTQPVDVGVAGASLVVTTKNHLTDNGLELWTAPLP